MERCFAQFLEVSFYLSFKAVQRGLQDQINVVVVVLESILDWHYRRIGTRNQEDKGAYYLVEGSEEQRLAGQLPDGPV